MFKSLVSAFIVSAGLAACSSSIAFESYSVESNAEAKSLVSVPPPENAWYWLDQVAKKIEETPDRVGGSLQERQMADWLTEQWREMGYDVNTLPFSYTARMKEYQSLNLSIDLPGKSEKILIVGAHFDSVGIKSGSEGLIDNGSGVAALLSVAQQLKPAVDAGKLPFTVRLIAFGAEERGLQGARNYVNREDVQRQRWIGMINLDTIIGGDFLYVHSAHNKPYNCKGVTDASYNNSTTLRDGLKKVSDQLFNDKAHQLHPATEGYPMGQTGGWSDHAPFACTGIPISYLEATNFTIKGKRGYDGYSQTTETDYWTCFENDAKTACDRFKEKGWGEIWHTKYDTAAALFPVMKERLKLQQQQNVSVLVNYLLKPELQPLP